MTERAIIASRQNHGTPDFQEIRRLVEASGAEVVGAVRQTRPEDPGLHFGQGKVSELADMVEATGADSVVIDGTLTPSQSVNLEEALATRVIDRHRLVLEIFAQQARTKAASVQIELARLRYRLPRVRERADEGALNRFTETGTPYYDLLDRIDRLERKRQEIASAADRRREHRREEGFDLVAIAGYTNAGKTALLRRLADEMELPAERHPDIEETAAVEDRLFKTLETTTRRATICGRDVLLTDTVGFLDDLPHWIVESFRGTLRETADADAILLVTDSADPMGEFRRKLRVAVETIGDDTPPIIPVLNKRDLIDDSELELRRAVVEEILTDPVSVSATQDAGIEGLRDRLHAALPELGRERFTIPLSDTGMSVLSWIHEEAAAVEVTYDNAVAHVDVHGKPAVLGKTQSRVDGL